jgi:hypothetical protein
MKKIARVVGLCSRPLQRRYLSATPSERAEIRTIVERESDWIMEKMARKGYRLEGTVGEIYGIFTRGHGRGTIRLQQEVGATT